MLHPNEDTELHLPSPQILAVPGQDRWGDLLVRWVLFSGFLFSFLLFLSGSLLVWITIFIGASYRHVIILPSSFRLRFSCFIRHRYQSDSSLEKSL